MADRSGSAAALSPWWRHATILVMIGGFSVLSFVTVLTYTNAPPIPERAVDAAGNQPPTVPALAADPADGALEESVAARHHYTEAYGYDGPLAGVFSITSSPNWRALRRNALICFSLI